MKIFLISLLFAFSSFASEDHKDHGHETKTKTAVHQDEHEEHDDHNEEKINKDGFSLNEKSVKTFDLKFIKYMGSSTSIPLSAIYKGLNEVNLFRMRNGLFKRIDFTTLKRDKETFIVSSKDLNPGDQIVIAGIGFLRMAEIAASGGLSDSHSH